MADLASWWHCPACDVLWLRDAGLACWHCGGPGSAVPESMHKPPRALGGWSWAQALTVQGRETARWPGVLDPELEMVKGVGLVRRGGPAEPLGE